MAFESIFRTASVALIAGAYALFVEAASVVQASNAGDRGIADSRIRNTPCRYRRANCGTRCTFSNSERQDREMLRAGSGLRSTNYQAKSRITYLYQGPFRPGYQPRVHRSQL